ncbi:MAG: hypothetical protein CSA72_00905 [Rhodobacterales bacterium]|nr:MAG: hypothetical protein CSA72_00905 [Rhodobacterales bacterium]
MPVSNTRFEERLARISAQHGQVEAQRARGRSMLHLRRRVGAGVRLTLMATAFALGAKTAALVALGGEGYGLRLDRLTSALPEPAIPVAQIAAPDRVSLWLASQVTWVKHKLI